MVEVDSLQGHYDKLSKYGKLWEALYGKRTRLLSEISSKINPLAEARFNTIKRFSIKKIAEDLGCVDCQEPRQETDWLTAENHVNKKFTRRTLLNLALRDLILRSYDILRNRKAGTEGEELPEISSAIINGFAEELEDFIAIMECLLAQSEEELNELFSQAAMSEEGMHMYLGRELWNWGYQQIRDSLPRPPYGKINLG